ncbi:MAG: iron ABC transporter permease [Spirochaetales bacterium]|nr:iron ABC transporter permease [Spirochaetales bacterium]
MKRTYAAKILALCVVLPLLMALSLLLGSVSISPHSIWSALSSPAASALDPGEAAISPDPHTIIIRTVRLPRILTAVGAGAGLGLAGLLMQTVFRNALAGPGVLGVSAGAGLGVALTLLAGIGGQAAAPTTIAAIAGSGVVLAVMVGVNRVVDQPVLLLVLGLLFGYAANAVTTLLMASSPTEGLERYIVWSFGSFALPPGPAPFTLVVVAVAAALLLSFAGPTIDALLLGSAYAESSGVHAKRTQGALILLAGTLTGLITAFAGPISFLGVAVPHIARSWLKSSRHRLLAPATALVGSLLAVGADLVSRVPGSGRVLPLNAVTALVGVPVVLAVVLRAYRDTSGRGSGL